MAARRVSLQAVVVVLAALIAAAGGLFALKHRVRGLEQELAQVRQRIEAEQWALRTTRADLAYLVRPDRLAMQAQQLGLISATGSRIARDEQLPIPLLLAADARPFTIPLPSGAEARFRFKPYSFPAPPPDGRRP